MLLDLNARRRQAPLSNPGLEYFADVIGFNRSPLLLYDSNLPDPSVLYLCLCLRAAIIKERITNFKKLVDVIEGDAMEVA